MSRFAPAKAHHEDADSGIEGYLNFFDDTSRRAKKLIVQVKSGYTGVPHLRDLKGVLACEKAAIGVLITLREPAKPMIKEAVSAGFYEPRDFPGRYPRLQILTVAELLEGKKIQFPEHHVETVAEAERRRRREEESISR